MIFDLTYHLKALPLSFQKIIIWITSTKVMAVQRCLIYYVYMIIIIYYKHYNLYAKYNSDAPIVDYFSEI